VIKASDNFWYDSLVLDKTKFIFCCLGGGSNDCNSFFLGTDVDLVGLTVAFLTLNSSSNLDTSIFTVLSSI